MLLGMLGVEPGARLEKELDDANVRRHIAAPHRVHILQLYIIAEYALHERPDQAPLQVGARCGFTQ